MASSSIDTELVAAIRSNLTPDLLKKGQTGHCYVASEAYYHLRPGWTPYVIRHEGATHWFLRAGGEVLDITADQFRTPVPYAHARRCPFLTKKPSKRTMTLVDRLRKMKPENCRKNGTTCPECGRRIEYPGTTCAKCGYTIKTMPRCMRH